MRKKNTAKNAQLYFSSSSEDNDRPIAPQTEIPTYQPQFQPEQKKQIFPKINKKKQKDPINQLSGSKLIDIFCDDRKMLQLYLQSKQNQTQGIAMRLLWRLHYILGQIVIQVQQFLLVSGRLTNSILLKDKQVQKISLFFLQQTQSQIKDDDYINARDAMAYVYKSNAEQVQKVAIKLYNYFNKIIFKPYQFQMVLSGPEEHNMSNHSSSKRNKNPVDSLQQKYRNPFQSTKNSTFSSTKKSQYYPISSVIEPSKSFSSPDPKQPIDVNSDQITPVIKWTSHQQAIFCKIYSSHDSTSVCIQLMEKELGPDGRWRSPNQIEQKMHSLATKVFNKFASLNASNQYLKTFMSNKQIVLQTSSPPLRKKMFRCIAIIYQSMLKVNEEKKAIISNKIVQVNKMCAEAALLN